MVSATQLRLEGEFNDLYPRMNRWVETKGLAPLVRQVWIWLTTPLESNLNAFLNGHPDPSVDIKGANELWHSNLGNEMVSFAKSNFPSFASGASSEGQWNTRVNNLKLLVTHFTTETFAVEPVTIFQEVQGFIDETSNPIVQRNAARQLQEELGSNTITVEQFTSMFANIANITKESVEVAADQEPALTQYYTWTKFSIGVIDDKVFPKRQNFQLLGLTDDQRDLLIGQGLTVVKADIPLNQLPLAAGIDEMNVIADRNVGIRSIQNG